MVFYGFFLYQLTHRCWYGLLLLPRQANDRSIEAERNGKLEEILRSIRTIGSTIANETAWAANLHNLRLNIRQDVTHIVDESHDTILETVATVGADQSVESRRLAGEVLQAVTDLGRCQSTSRRRLARELAGLTIRIPSHAVLLPPRKDESQPLTETEREASSWTERLKVWHAEGKRGGKGWATKEYRLFFLCGHDGSLAVCGFEGKGYRIKCPRTWLKAALPFVKALLVVANASLKTFAGLSIPVDSIVSVGGKALGEVLSSMVEVAVEHTIDAASSTLEEKLDEGSAPVDSVGQTRRADGLHGVGSLSNVSSQILIVPGAFRCG